MADDDEQAGQVTVRYPRDAQAEKQLHREATERLMRARTPEDALAVVLCLLLAQRLVGTDGLRGADRQGVYEPQELAAPKMIGELASRLAPPSVKQHMTAREAERERREQEWRDQQTAKLAEQRERLEPITLPDDAAEKHGSHVHTGDCEQQWGSAYGGSDLKRMDISWTQPNESRLACLLKKARVCGPFP